MKKLILVLAVFAIAAFGQRGGQRSGGQQGHIAPTAPHVSAPQQAPQQPHYNVPANNNGWSRFGQPGTPIRPPVRPPTMRPPIIIQRPIVVRPHVNFGFYPWSTYYGWGYWPYYPWFYGTDGIMLYRQPQPCKKETLKDSSGAKHDVLVCIQPDGTTQITDANTLVPAPAK